MITLRLDKNGGINKGDIKAFEHDNLSEVYVIQLYKNGAIYDLTNKTVELSIVEKKRKLGDMISLPIYEATEGKVKLEVVSTITKQDGIFDFKLTVKDTTGLIETFPSFQVKIENDITDHITGEIVQDKNFTILTEGLKALADYNIYKTNALKVPDIEQDIVEINEQLDTITNYVSKFNNFIEACNYCVKHNQNLTLDSDVTVLLDSDLIIPNIFGNGKTININGTGKLTTTSNIKIDNLTLVNSTGDMTWFCLYVENNFTSLNNIIFKNFINPCILNSKKVILNHVSFYNCGQGVYLRNTSDSEINNILFINATSERDDIKNNYQSSSTGINGYDGILLENCNNIIINNPIIQGCPERALYSSASNNITVNNPICKYTGGLKFVGYNNVVVENFVVNNATIDEVNGDALFQLYRCKNIYINGVTSFSSDTNSCGWIIRSGQTVENVKLNNCNATRVIRSIFDFDADFPSRASETYCRKVELQNIKAYNVGLIKWLPYPVINLDKRDVIGNYVFSDITLKDSNIVGFSVDNNADYGSPNGYGIGAIVKGDMIERLNIENNEIKGTYDCNTDGGTKTFPQLFFDLGDNVNQIKIKHKFKSKYFSINNIIPSTLKVTHDSLIEILCNSGIDTTNVKIKPYATNSDSNINLLNSFILEFVSNNFSNKGTAWLELTDISKTKNGKITCIADNKICDFLFDSNNIVLKTTDDIFGNTWLNDGKIRLYTTDGKLILRCGVAKDIISTGLIMCKS